MTLAGLKGGSAVRLWLQFHRLRRSLSNHELLELVRV